MTPIDQVKQLYSRYPQPNTFAQDAAYCLHAGHLFATPTAFVMGWQIPDAWFVLAAAGDLREILTFIPKPLPFVAFARRGGSVKYYQLERLQKLCASMILSPTHSLVHACNSSEAAVQFPPLPKNKSR